MKKYAVRNLSLCTKDCLCLFVCPYGATDTENSIIDKEKCTGCGACAEACPSKAISMVPTEFPPQQEKKEEVIAVMNALAQSKADQEKMALEIAEAASDDGLYRLMKAVAASLRLLGADIMREAGYMLPQSNQTYELLKDLISNPPAEDFPADTAKKIIEAVSNQENKAEPTIVKWVCTVCGYVHEGEQPPEQCPVCRQPAEKFKKAEESH